MKKYFLGIDTSNYTTSAALCDENGTVIKNIKKLLPVRDGEKGLRQSDALFHHTVQLPEIIGEAVSEIDGHIAAVGASCRPRDAAGSYMPCFLAGKSAGIAAARVSGCDFYEFSHQCGHISAALYSAERNDLCKEMFAAFHVSGGTTDILLVGPSDETVFKVEHIGGTIDLNAGQVIDRTGVMMGIHFPCGREIEKLALSYGGAPDKVSVCVKGLECNLSGVENKVRRLYDETADRERCSAYVISFINKTLEKLTENLRKIYPDIPIVYAGGVMSCSIIKENLSKYGSFAAPEFSSDNAAGIALMTRRKYGLL